MDDPPHGPPFERPDPHFRLRFEAVDLLENEWPLRKGERYEQAVRTCRRALNRMTPAALAREAFIAACLEAGVPLVMAAPTRKPQGTETNSTQSA